MSGTNAFKRAVQDRRLSRNLTDARKERRFDTFPEDPKTEVVIINGREYIRPLPTDQQRFTDGVQLKHAPIFRLVRTKDNRLQPQPTNQSKECNCQNCHQYRFKSQSQSNYVVIG